jgi:hypothetical protein
MCTYAQLLRLGPATLDGQALGAEFDPPLGSPAAEEAAFERYMAAAPGAATAVWAHRVRRAPRLLADELAKISRFYLALESDTIALYPRVYEPMVKAAVRPSPH